MWRQNHGYCSYLLSKSVPDTTSEAVDSNAYDRGVLDSLLQFKPFPKNNADKIQLKCVTRPTEHFEIGEPELTRIERLKAKIPEPRAVVISGRFDVIEHQKTISAGAQQRRITPRNN